MSQNRKQRILGEVQKQRRRRAITATVAVAALMVVVIVVLILLQGSGGSSGLLGAQIPQSMYGQFSGVSDSTLNGAVSAPGVDPLKSIGGVSLSSGGKPEFLYIGAEYCPFCAAERWSIIVALSRFGTFTGLTYMQSSSSDTSPNTATFSFLHASYISNVIAFVSVEQEDRNQSPLQTITSDEQNLMNQYDPGGSIPFIDVGGLYAIKPAPSTPNVYAGSQYPPGILSGQNWTQIASQLNIPSSNIGLSIDGAADTIISAICRVDGGVPSNVCSQAYATIIQSPLGLPSTYLTSFSTPDTKGAASRWTIVRRYT